MEIIAQNQIRISPRKIRLIVDSVKNLPLESALDALSVLGKRGSEDIRKVMLSAVANAVNNAKLDRNTLRIKEIDVAQTQTLRRFRPSTRGRTHPYTKRGSRIKVILEAPERGEINGTQS